MKALAILFRLVFSILVLLAVACYLQVSPTTSLNEFCSSINIPALLDQLCGINYLTVSLALVVLLNIFSITRILDAIWNTLFCASILVLIASGLYTLAGPGIALPSALLHNEAVNQFCQNIAAYEIPLAITLVIFVAGWVCASASGRVAITAVISYALWYGVTELFTYASQLWADNASPALPDALCIIQGTPWILAAVPGAFFLIYALLMACFETYMGNSSKKPPKEQAKTKVTDDKDNKSAESTPKAKKEQKPAEPVSKTKPVLKLATATAPVNKLKPTTPSNEKPAPAVEEKKEEPKKEEKPVEEKKETPAVETKEEKPADKAPEVTAEAEKPVEEPAESKKSAPEDDKKPEKSVEASDSQPEQTIESKTEDKAEEKSSADSVKE